MERRTFDDEPMKIRIVLYLFLLSFVETTTAQVLWNTEEAYPKREIRAVWVTTLSGLDWPKTKATSQTGIARQQAELCQLLDQLKAANINTILLQTRVRGSVIYPSGIEPWDNALTGQYDRNPGYDPLAFAVEECHRRGMELHTWIVTIPAFKVNVAKKMGGRGLLSTHPELLKKHNDMYYLDPGLPGTADYLSSLLREFIGKYDIDGIHFDYIRYPENANSFPDESTYRKYGKGQAKADWRRDNITAIVRRLYREVKAVKPWVKMSCSPVGKYRDTRRYSSRGWNCYDAVYQDAQGWLKEGIQDLLFPMMYFTGDHFYPFAADWKEGSHGRYVAPGLGIYFLSPNEKDWDLSVISRELHYLRRRDLGGQAYFRSQFLTDNTKGIYNYLRQNYYACPALPPAYPWLDNETPTRPEGFTCTKIDRQMCELRWLPSKDNLPAGVRYNVYASKEYPVDVSRAENIIAANLQECRYTYNQQYGLHIAVTAIDRCGNESKPVQLGGGSTPFNDAEGGLHYMSHDGRTLKLPDLETEFYLITDLPGRELQTGKYAHQIDISQLPRGIYRVRTLQKHGISRLIGEFRK